MATRFFTPLRCVQNDIGGGVLGCARKDIWVEKGDGSPPPVFTGAGFRREDNE